MAVTATQGAVCFRRRVAELLRTGLGLRDRHATSISRHGLAVARGRLENQLSDLIFPPHPWSGWLCRFRGGAQNRARRIRTRFCEPPLNNNGIPSGSTAILSITSAPGSIPG